MPILLGALASLFIGVSDASGRASSRRADSVSHVTMQMAVGTVVTLPTALLLRNELIGRDLVAGLASGVMIAVALAIVYYAMAESSAAIVAPTAAVLAALVPLGWDLASGTEVGALAGLGCTIAIVSLALTTFNPVLGDRVRSGLLLAILGGVLFGISVIFAADTSEESGAWPAVTQRFAGFLAMVLLARSRGVPTMLPPGVRKFGVIGGVTGGLGITAWIVGSQLGDIGTVSVVASTYPAVVTLLAVTLDDDELRWWQALGIAGAITGAGLIALAQ